MSKDQILDKAIKVYGKDLQIDKAVEEMGECIAALQRFKLAQYTQEGPSIMKEKLKDVYTEIADVKIMMEQLTKIFGEEEIEEQELYKLKRLRKRLDKHYPDDTDFSTQSVMFV